MLQATLLVPGNYQGERRIKQTQIFDRPGKYRMKLPTVGVRTTGTVLVEMVDKNGLYFSDDFSLTFHMYYYKLLKWLLVLPMLGMFAVLVILRPQEAVPLPSFSRNTDLWWLPCVKRYPCVKDNFYSCIYLNPRPERNIGDKELIGQTDESFW
jgi:hypothetical protein